MAHSIVPTTLLPSSIGKKQLVVEEVKDVIPISPPNAVHVEETIFHLDTVNDTESCCFDEVDLELKSDFLAWLEKQPQDLQKEIMEGFDRINKLSLDELPQDETLNVEKVIPVNDGTYVFQNAFRKGQTVPCSRRGCPNQFQVDEVTSLFCSQCSP